MSHDQSSQICQTEIFILNKAIPTSKYISQIALRRPGFNPKSRHTKDFKMVLDTTLLNTQQYKVRIMGKVEQSKERSSALPNTSE